MAGIVKKFKYKLDGVITKKNKKQRMKVLPVDLMVTDKITMAKIMGIKNENK